MKLAAGIATMAVGLGASGAHAAENNPHAVRHHARRRRGRSHHADREPRHQRTCPLLRRHASVTPAARPDGTGKRRRARLRRLGGLYREAAIFRRDRRRVRQPHRQAQVHARRQEYTLATNNGPNALHGGKKGFDKVVWKAADGDRRPELVGDARPTSAPTARKAIPASSTPADLHADRQRTSCGSTTCDDRQAHAVNLTNHSYFNLAGQRHRHASSTTCS